MTRQIAVDYEKHKVHCKCLSPLNLRICLNAYSLPQRYKSQRWNIHPDYSAMLNIQKGHIHFEDSLSRETSQTQRCFWQVRIPAGFADVPLPVDGGYTA